MSDTVETEKLLVDIFEKINVSIKILSKRIDRLEKTIGIIGGNKND